MYIKYCTFKSQTVFLDNFTCPCLYFEFVYFWIISNFVSTFVSIFINFLLSFISTIIIFPILSSPFPILFVKLVHSIPLLPPKKILSKSVELETRLGPGIISKFRKKHHSPSRSSDAVKISQPPSLVYKIIERGGKHVPPQRRPYR